jgi:hypothetical protein
MIGALPCSRRGGRDGAATRFSDLSLVEPSIGSHGAKERTSLSGSPRWFRHLAGTYLSGAGCFSGERKKTKEQQMAETLERRETANMIGSDKVEGTNVYRSNGDKIGQIERIMLDKLSGKVAYAVMSFGGFLGMGHEHYPVPWSLLKYNTSLGGYEVNISDQQLKGAPGYSGESSWDYEDRKRAQQVYDYYRVPPYWM